MVSQGRRVAGRTAVAVPALAAVWAVRAWLDSVGAPGALIDTVAALTAAVLAATRTGNRRGRIAWSCQSAAATAWVAAPLTWSFAGEPLPWLSPDDAGRAAFLLLAATGFWLTSRDPDRRARIRMFLDGTVGAAALFIVIWALQFTPIWAAADGRPLAAGPAVAYPLGAIGLLTFYSFLTVTR